GLVLARSRRDRPRRLLAAEPGLADHPVGRAAARHRCVGARLLPEVPKPPPRVPRGVVERRQLASRRRALCAGDPQRALDRELMETEPPGRTRPGGLEVVWPVRLPASWPTLPVRPLAPDRLALDRQVAGGGLSRRQNRANTQLGGQFDLERRRGDLRR